ncbi:Rap1a/Tai family immunity protein [Ferrovibrio sp.]|uniref:Rap1a/Tai family immunity protein n=1 Tax=Ferrovibrio sp. TaxID=1917215 RepID=UPI002632B5C8|nr:Rap1a/Tai family immunity protein [Ferrovibrio sp.]
MRCFFSTAVLAVAFAFSASAQQQTPAALQPPPRFLAKDLQTLCEGAEGSARLTGCLRYLQGAVAIYELAVAEGKELTWFCAPREAPAAMLRQQFVEWARDNTDQMGTDAIQAVKLALADAYPCQGD